MIPNRNAHHPVDFRLQVQNLGKHYSRMLLFKKVSFSLKTGENLAITGWNGSGKSTLLRIIAGLVKPSAGSVAFLFDGNTVPEESRRRHLGMVAPALSMYHEMTARENLVFFSRVRGIQLERQEIDAMLEKVGLAGRGDDVCKAYSSGMIQRLKFAQALLHSPPLLLLDEPCSNLDSKGVHIVENVIHRQRQIGATLIASNEKREIDYADRVINLSE